MREMEFRFNHRNDPEVVEYLFKLVKSGLLDDPILLLILMSWCLKVPV